MNAVKISPNLFDLKLFIQKYYDSFIIDIKPLVKHPLTQLMPGFNLLGRYSNESEWTKRKFMKLVAKVPSSKYPDLIKSFIDICEEIGYKTAAKLVQNDLTVLERYCIDYVDTFLDDHAPKICEEMGYSEELLNNLREEDLLTFQDYENIKQRCKSEGPCAALKLLCHRVTARNPRWLPYFYIVLFKINGLPFIEDIDEILYNKIKEIKENDTNYREVIRCIELHFDTLAGESAARKESSDDVVQPPFDQYSEEREEEAPGEEILYMRKYQMELVQRALTGSNTIICAPTNSGKTYMATHIILEHLKNNPEGKVAFLVHRVPLVDQQAAVLERYLKSFDYRVGRASGFMRDDLNLPNLLNTVDVLVMTAGILVNAFEERRMEKKVESITTFTLLVFDECHNCTGYHVYKQIMDRYMTAKPNQPKSRMPQVIGMTASFGTNKASNVEEAKEHIMTIMANFDCYHVDTVVQNIDELRTMLPDPVSKFILPSSRSDDVFESKLENVMKFAENFLKIFQKNGYFKPNEDITHLIENMPQDHSSSVYTNFVGSLRYLHHRACDNRKQRSDIIAVYEVLDACNQAYKINRLFRAKDAVNHLNNQLQLYVDENKFSQVRNQIYARIIQDGLLNERQWPASNPVLENVISRLEDQFTGNSDSRSIIFVRERLYVDYLENCFKDHGRLDAYGYMGVVGARNPNEDVKMTHSKQKNILEDFRKGKCKILFATNVIEEGLDVPECNLVIRYCHITNEISMQQSKGRARAKGSEYLVVVPKGEEWIQKKEQKNNERKQLEEQALAEILNLDLNTLKQQIDAKRNTNTYRPRRFNLYDSSHLFSLRCRGCHLEICLNVDIKKYHDQHFFMVSEEKLRNLAVKYHDPNSKDYNRRLPGQVFVIGKIHCVECKKSLGNIAKTKDAYYPCFKLMKFTVHNLDTDMDYPAMKWKDSPFRVDESLTENDIQNRQSIGDRWLNDRLIE